MRFRWVILGAASLILAGVDAEATQPPRERDGGLLPPDSAPPVVQVVAKQPADEEEVLVELVKVMPRPREEVKAKEEKNDNFRVIKMKREDLEPTPPAPPPPAPPRKLVTRPIQPTETEPLKFLPAKQQLPTTPKPAETALFPGEKSVKIVKVPVHEKPQASAETAWLSFTLPEVPNPFSGYPGAVCDYLHGDQSPGPFASVVGWIDPSTVATRARLRVDGRYHNDRPDRAEFFTARNQQFFANIDEGISGRGFPIPERSINMRETALYVEYAFSPRWSAFVEGTLREMDPLENANSGGLGDMNAGFRVAYFMMPDQVQTFQLRIVAPTGRPESGLGNGHATLEPGLLLWQKISDDWTLESEIRDWIPLGGTNYAGNVLRYGLGLSYSAYRSDRWSVTPVGEIIGWSVLRGKESRFVNLLPTFQETHEARGTIFEAALGFRGTISSQCDWYLGYARTLSTSKAWFDDNLRLEVRWNF